MAGGTATMALAIWIGATVEQIYLTHFHLWLLGGLAVGSIFAVLLRLARRASLASLRGSPILALWFATRFLLTPAFLLLWLAWLVCLLFGVTDGGALSRAVTFAAIYGGAAILATSILADVAAAIKGAARIPPSDG